jgi:hypothetical protein
MAKLPAPTKLGPKARKVWTEITGVYDLRTDELLVLEDCCREIDIVERLEEEFRDAPTMVKGSMGQLVASPMLQELRQHRAVVARLLKQLNLPDEDGRQGQSTSDLARKAANARWSRGA